MVHNLVPVCSIWSYETLVDFAIQWRVQLYTAHVSVVQLKMVDRTWIPEMGRKPVAILRHFIPSKSLLLQWLFNLPL